MINAHKMLKNLKGKDYFIDLRWMDNIKMDVKTRDVRMWTGSSWLTGEHRNGK
jgi:hypothetical protein